MRLSLFLYLVFALYCGVVAQNLQIRYGGDPLSEKDRIWIERFLTSEIEFYARFGLKDTTNLKLTVFEKKQDAWYYLDSIKVALPSLHAGGLYIPGKKEAIILGREKWRERSSKIIIHELTHHLSRQTIKRLPGWLNEGLSKYFENCELGKKGLKHTLGDYERGRIRTMYMLGEVDLKSFIDNTNGDFRKKLLTDESYAYVLSHALVTFGLEVAEKEFMENFIALLNKKMTGVRYSQLIDAVYPGGFMQFERDFTDFCNSD